VILTGTTIEADLFKARRQRALGDGSTDGLGGGAVAAIFNLSTQFFVDGAGGHQGAAILIVDQLRVHMFVTTEHGQTRTLDCAAGSLADAPGAPLALLDKGPIVIHGSTSTLLKNDTAKINQPKHFSAQEALLRHRLARLATDDLIVVTNALALIRLRFAYGAGFGSELADHLLVRSLDHDVRLIRAGDGQACGNR
jgi:hypothetical protein